jgi:hypothetical protein
LLQTKRLFNSTLGPPLRHAWVALGPPKGHPRVTQTQSQTQAGRGSQRFTKYQVPSTKNQVPAFWLIASCQLPAAHFQRSSPSHPEALVDYRRFFRTNKVGNRTMTPTRNFSPAEMTRIHLPFVPGKELSSLQPDPGSMPISFKCDLWAGVKSPSNFSR